MNIDDWLCRHAVTSLVTSSTWKCFFWQIEYVLSISDDKLELFIIFKKFEKWRNFELAANIFNKHVTGNWVCYVNSQEQFLNFELLIDVLAKKMTELWQFQNVIYLLTSWPSYLTFDLEKLQGSSLYMTSYVDQVWWRLLKKCNMYRVPNKQTDRQTNIPLNEHTCKYFYEILASNIME